MVELPNATGQTGETAPGDLLHLLGYITGPQWNGRSFFQDHL